MLILGIESTCDETGVAVVENGTKIKSNFIASSVTKLAQYGGIVPEVVARDQVKFVIPLIEKSLNEISLKQINAIAVSYGPGLIGSLLVGVETAKVLSLVWKKPLIGVNHLKGHIYSNWLEMDKLAPKFPLVALIVSGGHTDLVLMKSHSDFTLLGSTLDDAAGEAFDKIARVLGLGFPGGPQIEKSAYIFNTSKHKHDNVDVEFPRSLIKSGDFNFSFSGIKTSVANTVKGIGVTDNLKGKIAFEFQEAVCDVLVAKTIKAANEFGAKSIVVGGGVSANGRLRDLLFEKSKPLKIDVFFPSKFLSVDNGAMIAAAAFFENKTTDSLKLNTNPLLHFN